MAVTTIQLSTNVNLTNCDLEAVHLIGAIQPMGFLVAASLEWVVTQVSANATDFLGCSTQSLLGMPLRNIVSARALHMLRNHVALLRGPNAIERLFAVQLQDDGASYDIAVFRTQQAIVIEAEPSEPAGEINAGAMVRSMLGRMEGQASLCREAARLIRALTGFSRVMIYRFHPDETGEVIAESMGSGLESYLGLRYPASDIPRQARALLLRNPVRLLFDTAVDPCPVVPHSGATDDLDLSLSTLRAHSPIHREYLTNMGVRATMTISLVSGGKLWGLIACHHMTPRHVGFERRTTAELFARMFMFLVEDRERKEVSTYEQHARQIHNQLVATLLETGSHGETLARLAGRMSEIIPCDGIGVFVAGKITLEGQTPTRDGFRLLLRHLGDLTAESEVYAVENLGEVHRPAINYAAQVAGILVLPISRVPRDYIVFFRRETACSVTWAGKPDKVDDGVRLSPRKSFAAWREIVRGHCAPWTESEVRTADALRIAMLELMLHLTSITEKEQQAAAQKQEMLIAELNHRVRNILGLMRGLVAQSQTSAADVATFATVLGDRVHALARAHDQITAKNWGPGSLATLIATEAGAYLGTGATRVHASGPAILLQPQAFSTLALVIHELMTNAAKYGALQNSAGLVAVTWALSPETLTLEWSEAHGPAVIKPMRRGFGSTIIERSIPHELGGQATITYAPTGLCARFTMPARHAVLDDTVELDLAPAVEVNAATPVRLSGPVLLVEDNMIIALDAEDMLFALGAERVIVASNVADALEQLELETPSFAFLDINLGLETSWPVATRLLELGVPHIFTTGYGNGIEYPAEHRMTPHVTKPYSSQTISDALAKAFQHQRGRSIHV